jgi:hypothetical protein
MAAICRQNRVMDGMPLAVARMPSYSFAEPNEMKIGRPLA